MVAEAGKIHFIMHLVFYQRKRVELEHIDSMIESSSQACQDTVQTSCANTSILDCIAATRIATHK